MKRFTASTADATASAIIGVAFEFSQCDDWHALTGLLREGRDVIRQLPQERAAATGVERGDRGGAWITDITGFDYRYFGLARSEAELIDPRQRRMLQLAVQAIGDAGYAPAELSGRSGAVLVAAYGGPQSSLFNLLPPGTQREGAAATGSLHALAAGRIAYYLDFRGAAEVVDTACSSFLVALHEARWKLARGECDLALVGGYELALGDTPQTGVDFENVGVLSPSDRCLPFDAAADGTTYGEGGGFVLVKRLTDALRDGDRVHAVVRGSAVNQDSRRRTGITAPSPSAQTEAITAAWRESGVDPAAVGYIEAHGTGTKIGDPIEIRGLTQAFASMDPSPRAPWVSSVKANLGHTSSMAGLAGLARIIAQFRAHEIFPTAGFRTPNPLLDLGESAALRIADRVEPWDQAAGGSRFAAISSFGMSGTNAHMVLEAGPEAGPDSAPAQPQDLAERAVVLSARDPGGLRRLVSQLRELVARDPAAFDLAAAASVLAAGREHFEYRLGWVVHDAAELLACLDGAVVPARPVTPPPPVAVAFGDLADVPLSRLREAAATYPAFARTLGEAEAHLATQPLSSAQRALLWLAGGYAVLADAGVEPQLILSHGIGVVAARLVRRETTMLAALDAVAAPGEASRPPKAEALRAALASEHTIVDLAPGSSLSGLLAPDATSVGAALVRLYQQGRDLDWGAAVGRPGRRVELPTAPFAVEHCWPVVAATARRDVPAPPQPAPPPAPPGDQTIADVVLQYMRDVLKEPELTLSDDFLAVGGTSINGVQVMTRINDQFGTDLDVLDLFDAPDLQALAAVVASAAPGSPAGQPAGAGPAATAQAPGAAGPLSEQQQAVWDAHRHAADSGAHNLPVALLIEGDVDPDQLAGRLASLAARHPMLRARLLDTPQGPRQAIAAPAPVPLSRIELDLAGLTEQAGRGELLDRLQAIAAVPLPLDQGPGAARYELIRVRFADGDRHVLLMTFHQAFVDVWSGHVLIEELCGGHDDASTPGRPYLDYVRDQGQRLGERTTELDAFWTGYLAGARFIPLPEAGKAAAGGGLIRAEIGQRPTAELAGLAQEQRCSGHILALAAWLALVGQVTGERDVTVAVPVSGRAIEDERVIGCYANPVPQRVLVRPGRPFAELLADVRRTSLLTLDYHAQPWERIVRACAPAEDARALTMFTYSNDVAVRRLGPDGPAAEVLDLAPGSTSFPVSATVVELGGRLQVRLQYSGQVSRSTAQEWLASYTGLLARLTERGVEPTPSQLVPAGSRPPELVSLPLRRCETAALTRPTSNFQEDPCLPSRHQPSGQPPSFSSRQPRALRGTPPSGAAQWN